MKGVSSGQKLIGFGTGGSRPIVGDEFLCGPSSIRKLQRCEKLGFHIHTSPFGIRTPQPQEGSQINTRTALPRPGVGAVSGGRDLRLSDISSQTLTSVPLSVASVHAVQM